MKNDVHQPRQRSLAARIGGALVGLSGVIGAVCAVPALYLANAALTQQIEGSADQTKIRENSDAVVALQKDVVSWQKQTLEIDVRLLEVQRQQLEAQRAMLPPTSRTAKGIDELIRLNDQQLKVALSALDELKRIERDRRVRATRTAQQQVESEQNIEQFRLKDPFPEASRKSRKIWQELESR